VKIIRLIALLSITSYIILDAKAEGMCNINEVVIFNCELKKSTSSLCKSKDHHTLTYRNGTKNKTNIEISDYQQTQKNLFLFSNTFYSGGGEAHIRFSNSGYTYYLYDKTIKTDDEPIFSAGIAIYQGEKKISNLICNNDAAIHQEAYQDIAKERFRDIKSK
jgi:hypothetical protein